MTREGRDGGDEGDPDTPTATDPADVRDTYDRIAGHFAKTREYPWPETTEFLDGAGAGVGLDLGCGNGRNLPPLANAADRAVGVDLSRPLLALAAERVADAGVGGRVDLVEAEATRLPVAAGAVDLALYVATLHHLPGRERRLSSLDELARVLSGDGRALVSAWSTAHDRFDVGEGGDRTVDWTLPDGEVVGRYYHIYEPDEFERDLAESRLAVERSWISSGNCYAVVGADGDGY